LLQGGTAIYDGSQIEALNAAIANYDAKLTDPKSHLIVRYTGKDGKVSFSSIHYLIYSNIMRKLEVMIQVEYQAPDPPKGLFDEFLPPVAI
jgi:hypothetical protein